MIQLNLLPDVKLQYLKAERTKRLVMGISAVVSIATLALLLILVGVTQLQEKHLNDLNKDIKSSSSKLQSQPDLNKILTVQNQLSSLTNLHNTKPAAARLFTYLTQVVPDQVHADNLVVDFNQHTATISGMADSLSTVNKFVDTLKFTNYSAAGSKSSQPAFSNVVLSSFGLSNNQATYTVTFNYDPPIFDITQQITLSVPSLITTRSELDKPSDLFVSAPAGSNPASITNTQAGQ